MRRTRTLVDAVLAGDSDVIAVLVGIAVMAILMGWLAWALRPVKPRKGGLTVTMIEKRLEQERQEAEALAVSPEPKWPDVEIESPVTAEIPVIPEPRAYGKHCLRDDTEAVSA